MPGCGHPTTGRGRGGPDLSSLGVDLRIPALGGYPVDWWLSGGEVWKRGSGQGVVTLNRWWRWCLRGAMGTGEEGKTKSAGGI